MQNMNEALAKLDNGNLGLYIAPLPNFRPISSNNGVFKFYHVQLLEEMCRHVIHITYTDNQQMIIQDDDIPINFRDSIQDKSS